MGVTQSALSQSIKGLEDKLEKQLFIRSPKGMFLTDDGKNLYNYIKQGVKLFETAYNVLKEKQGDKVKELRIGTSQVLANKFVLDKLKKINEVLPDIKIKIVNYTNFNERLFYLKDGSLDLMIFKDTKSFKQKDFNVYKIKELNYVFFYNPKYFSFDKQITLSELQQLPLILKTTGTTTKEKFLGNYENSLSAKIECEHDESIIEATKLGLGIGYAPKEYLDNTFEILKIENEKPLSINVNLITYNESDFIKQIVKLLI